MYKPHQAKENLDIIDLTTEEGFAEMDFIEMWEEANYVDASIGGVDSIPEEEYFDYAEACLMALADDIMYPTKQHNISPPSV